MNLGKLALSLPVPGDVAACLEWARRAEDLGYESIWIAETGGPDPFVLAGAVAQVTKRVRIGLAVSPVYIRTPATIAAAAGTVSQLSAGRFILGLGSSSHAIVEGWHGVPFRKPLARVRETVTAVRGMLAGQKVALDGETLRTHGFRLMVPPAGPVPIYIGALRPAMLELAGEIGDGVAVNLLPAAAMAPTRAAIAAGARKAGKDPDAIEVVCRQQVVVTDDKAGARDLFRNALTGYFATPVYNRYAAWYGFEDEARMIAEGFRTGDRAMTRQGMTDRLVDAFAIFGTLDECKARLAEYAAAGVDTTAISVLSFDPTVFAKVIEGFAPGR
jgi:probable F420-dependent oxidoreductase